MPTANDTLGRGSARRWLFATLLVGATLFVYARVLGFPFVEWDDPEYISRNPIVQSGLTLEGVRWALGSTELANWFPLTLLSFMLEVALFGVNPAAHHGTNLALHCLNALLLFAVLSRATGRALPSGLVAALFALHPLHVESVAWITERKGLLSTLFGLLAMWVYLGYAQDRRLWRYALVALLFAASLLAKPMLVTLPFLLLLLDLWPLGRIAAPDERALRGVLSSLVRLSLEKLPLVLVSVAYGAVTLLAQHDAGATRGSDLIPLTQRLANAIVASVWYPLKLGWPTDLCALYVHPNLDGGTPWPTLVVVGSALLLGAVSCWTLAARQRPYLAVGWLWYLVSLVPVLGILQVGIQPFADRYSYVPSIGLSIMLAFGLDEALRSATLRWRWVRPAAAILCCLALLALAAATRRQVETWRSSSALFMQMLAVSPTNSVAHFKLANEYRDAEEPERAIEHYQEALRIHPSFFGARRELVRLLREQRRGDTPASTLPAPGD